MNKRQKEVAMSQLKDEEAVIKKLKATYNKAIRDINQKIKILQADKLTQSKIYQIEYQKALKMQIKAILDNMNANQYTDIQEYLKNCYEEGFLGTMYDLQGQGIPLVFPIDQNQVVKALVNDTKLSKSLYESLGFNVNTLKKQINAEISRGIANGYSYDIIARNVANKTNMTLRRSIRIARTEGHRVQQQATFDAQKGAKERGADIVKQWDSTMDKKTRPNHVKLDGQIREIDEPFEVNGKTAMFPADFGVPHEDINCRCVMLQRARWALGEDETTKMNNETGEIIKIKEKDFKSFKKVYNDSVEEIVNSASSSKNFDSLVKYCKNKYGIDVDDSVLGLNFNNCKKAFVGVESMFNDFPELKNNIRKLTTSKRGVMSCDGKVITFNPKYFGKDFDLDKLFEEQVKMGYWVKNATPTATGAHETAHAVESLLIDLNKTYEYEFQKIRAWNKCEEAKLIVSRACKNIKKTPWGKGKKNAELIGSISRYAQSDASEAMAEAFADVYANGENASPLSLEIKKLTINRYKKYKGVE